MFFFREFNRNSSYLFIQFLDFRVYLK